MIAFNKSNTAIKQGGEIKFRFIFCSVMYVGEIVGRLITQSKCENVTFMTANFDTVYYRPCILMSSVGGLIISKLKRASLYTE